MTLSVEPVHTQSVSTGPTLTQPVTTMTEHVSTITEHVFTMPGPTMNECAPIMPRPTMPVPTMNECTLTMPRAVMNEHAPTTPRPVMPVHTMNECALTMPKPTLPVHTMNEHTLTTPRPTVLVPGGHALTASMSTMPGHTMSTMSDSTVPMHTMSQPTVPRPTLPEGKPQSDMSSIVVHPSIPPAPMVAQPQVVFVKQFQPPKPYTGASSWKGYSEYFERFAAVNGWTTVEQKAEQLKVRLVKCLEI